MAQLPVDTRPLYDVASHHHTKAQSLPKVPSLTSMPGEQRMRSWSSVLESEAPVPESVNELFKSSWEPYGDGINQPNMIIDASRMPLYGHGGYAQPGPPYHSSTNPGTPAVYAAAAAAAAVAAVSHHAVMPATDDSR